MNHPAHPPALFDGTWCQRWRSRRPSWRRTTEGGFDPSRYHVTAIADPPARGFVAAHHYARTYPAARLRYGLVDNTTGRLVGVAVLGVPMSVQVLTGPFPPAAAVPAVAGAGAAGAAGPGPRQRGDLVPGARVSPGSRQGIRGVVIFSVTVSRSCHNRKAGSCRLDGFCQRLLSPVVSRSCPPGEVSAGPPAARRSAWGRPVVGGHDSPCWERPERGRLEGAAQAVD